MRIDQPDLADTARLVRHVKRECNYTVRLGVFESIRSAVVTDEKITLAVDRADVHEKRGELIITRRGVTLHSWKRNELDGWSERLTHTSWYDIEPEHYSHWAGLDPIEHARKSMWERMGLR